MTHADISAIDEKLQQYLEELKMKLSGSRAELAFVEGRCRYFQSHIDEVIAELNRRAAKQMNQDRNAELYQIAKELSKTMQCNCDLDSWEPEAGTGHSHVCRIHKAALAQPRAAKGMKVKK